MLLSRSEVAACQTSLLHFTSTTFLVNKRVPFLKNIHQVRVTDALERVLLGMCPRLIINVPPRSGKTELAVVNFIAWALGLYPDAEFIHVSYSGRLAGNNTWNARALITSPVYGEIFPAVGIRADSNARDEFRTTRGGVIYATGSEGSLTGYGAGKMRDGFGGCFPYWQEVETEHGPMQIGALVQSRSEAMVYGREERTGTRLLSPVTRLWRNPGNDLIRITLSDGSRFTCTPEHELLTSGGWVTALHLAKAFDLVNAESGSLAGFSASERSICRNAHDAFRVLWSCAPISIRQSCRDKFPCFSGLDLSDDPSTDAISCCNDGSAFAALEYFDDFFSGQFGTRPAFADGESTVPYSILHIVGLAAIREIAKAVVGVNAIHVANLITLGPFAYKLLSDQMGDVPETDLSPNGKVDPKIAFPIGRRLKRSQWSSAPDRSEVGYLVKSAGVSDAFPVFAEYVGHVEETFCLEVGDAGNFELSQSGAIVSNCILVDDPHKAGDVNYTVKRTRVLDFFKETLESRKNRPDTPIIVIMQRLHEDDLTGFLMAGGNGETWEHIVIPALDDAGQSFWERQFPAEKLRKMEAASSYVFAGQYQQRPAPKGGGMLKAEWFEVVPAAPAGVRWLRAWDLAASKEAESAFTAGVLMGVSKEGIFYVKDVTRLQGSAGEVKRTIAATASQDGRAVHGSIPQDPGAGGKAWAEDLIRAVAGYVYRATPESGDKETRAMPFAAQAEAGNVKLVRGAWNRAYLDELKLFPTGKFKDQVDASSRAFNELAGPVAVAEQHETGFY